jgi:hypothetical protein
MALRGVLWSACLLLSVQLRGGTYIAINSGGPSYQQNTSSTFSILSPPALNSTLPGSLVYQKDHYYTGFDTGVNNYSSRILNNTSDPVLFFSDREGKTVVYKVNVPAGIHSVSLYFAELDPVYQRNGLRVFDVLVQDQLVRHLCLLLCFGLHFPFLVRSSITCFSGCDFVFFCLLDQLFCSRSYFKRAATGRSPAAD